MDSHAQEELIHMLSTQKHLKNMAVFLAGLTQFRGLNRNLVKQAIQSECGHNKYTDGRQLTLSTYALQVVYETEDVDLLAGCDYYRHDLTDYIPPSIFTAVGYCISQSGVEAEDRKPCK